MPRLYAMVRWGPCAEGCVLACWARVGSCPQPFPCGAPGRWPDGRPGSVLATLGLVGATCPEDGCVREVDCRPAPLGASACVRGGLHRQDPEPSGRRRAQTWAFRPVRRAEPDSGRRHAQAQAGVARRPRPPASAGPGSDQRHAQDNEPHQCRGDANNPHNARSRTLATKIQAVDRCHGGAGQQPAQVPRKDMTTFTASRATIPEVSRPRCRWMTNRAANSPKIAPEAPTVWLNHADSTCGEASQ